MSYFTVDTNAPQLGGFNHLALVHYQTNLCQIRVRTILLAPLGLVINRGMRGLVRN